MKYRKWRIKIKRKFHVVLDEGDCFICQSDKLDKLYQIITEHEQNKILVNLLKEIRGIIDNKEFKIHSTELAVREMIDAALQNVKCEFST